MKTTVAIQPALASPLNGPRGDELAQSLTSIVTACERRIVIDNDDPANDTTSDLIERINYLRLTADRLHYDEPNVRALLIHIASYAVDCIMALDADGRVST